MDFEDNLYDGQLPEDTTTTRERKMERWDDEEIAILKKVVMEVMAEQRGSMPGTELVLFEIVAERLKAHGLDRTVQACLGKWKRIGEHSQPNASYDTFWEVNNSEHDETFEVESDDGTWGTPKATKRKAAQGKRDSRTMVPCRAWSKEEELIFFNYIKTRREQAKRSGQKTVMTDIFKSTVKFLKEKGYPRTPGACRNHWQSKVKEQMEIEESPENSSITVTPDATFSTPHSTSGSWSDDDVVSDIMATDEGIASGVKYRSTIRLSEGDALSNLEEAASDIESLDAQVPSEIFLDNGVKVSHEQKALLEEAFSKYDHFTTETLPELCRTTGLGSLKIMTWYRKKRAAANNEKKTVLLAANIEKDNSTPMGQLNEMEQGNNWTSKHSRTSDIINEPLGHERVSSDPRPSKKARYSDGGELSVDGQGDTTDMNSNNGDESTPLSNPTAVTATDSRQNSVETKPPFLPHLEEQIPTGYSPQLKGMLADERNEFQRRVLLAERNQVRLDLEIADHTARIEAEKLAQDQKRKELVQVQERLELAIADHTAKIKAEELAKARKEEESRQMKTSRMANMAELDFLDKMCRRGNIT